MNAQEGNQLACLLTDDCMAAMNVSVNDTFPLNELPSGYSVVPAALLMVTFSCLGIFGNISVFLAPVRNPEMRSAFNVLLALSSFMHIAALLPQWYFPLLFRQGDSSGGYMRLSGSFYLHVGPIVGFTCGGMLVLFAGLDRLMDVALSKVYAMVNKCVSLLLVLLVCAGQNAFVVLFGVLNAEANPKAWALGLMTDALHGYPLALYGKFAAVASVITLVTCVLLAICSRGGRESNHSESESGSASTNETYHSSLFFLLPINAITWAIVAALAFARTYMHEEVVYHLVINAHAVTAFTSAVNFYVLYFTSPAYKTEFHLQMRIVSHKIFWCKSLKVDPYTVTPPELANLRPWEYNLHKTGFFDTGPIFVRPGPEETAEIV